MKHLKVKNHVNLVRESSTNAILNTNMNDYNNYIAMRNAKKSEDEKIKSLELDLQDVKSDLNEIKNLLRNLINEPR